MFGTKATLRAYLNVIRPWAMGVDNRGWRHEDFFDHDPQNLNADWVAKEDVKAYRTNPSYIIFPINQYQITLLDRLFLGQKALAAVMGLNQTIANFNASLDAVNRASDIDTRWGRIVMLHVGLIGTTDGSSLHGQFNRTWAAAQ